MRPIALTFKEERNRYSSNGIGELMLIHICSACGAITKNRIAGDDNEYSIMKIYTKSFNIEKELLNSLLNEGIRMLNIKDFEIVNLRLYGKSIV